MRVFLSDWFRKGFLKELSFWSVLNWLRPVRVVFNISYRFLSAGASSGPNLAVGCFLIAKSGGGPFSSISASFYLNGENPTVSSRTDFGVSNLRLAPYTTGSLASSPRTSWRKASSLRCCAAGSMGEGSPRLEVSFNCYKMAYGSISESRGEPPYRYRSGNCRLFYPGVTWY